MEELSLLTSIPLFNVIGLEGQCGDTAHFENGGSLTSPSTLEARVPRINQRRASRWIRVLELEAIVRIEPTYRVLQTPVRAS